MKLIIKRKIKPGIIDKLLRRDRYKTIHEAQYESNHAEINGNILKIDDKIYASNVEGPFCKVKIKND